MGRKKLSREIKKDKLITIRINSERREKIKINKISPTKLFNEALDSRLKSVSEFDKPKKIRRFK